MGGVLEASFEFTARKSHHRTIDEGLVFKMIMKY